MSHWTSAVHAPLEERAMFFISSGAAHVMLGSPVETHAEALEVVLWGLGAYPGTRAAIWRDESGQWVYAVCRGDFRPGSRRSFGLLVPR